MLAKLTRGNQFTIPKPIVEKARLKAGRDYLTVTYFRGVIILKPIDVEDRFSPQAYEKLLADAFTPLKGDLIADERTADTVLKKRLKR